MPADLDFTDRKILDALQRDASRPVAEIAAVVGISTSPCWRRINRLEQEGYILRRVGLLDRRKVGLSFQVFTTIKMSVEGRLFQEDFVGQINEMPEVVECYPIMGSFDFLLRILVENVDAYERLFYERLSRLPGINEISSMVSFANVKIDSIMPVLHR